MMVPSAIGKLFESARIIRYNRLLIHSHRQHQED